MQSVEGDRVAAALAEQLAYYRRAAVDFDRHAQGAARPGRLARTLADLGWAAQVEPLWETFFAGWAHPG